MVKKVFDHIHWNRLNLYILNYTEYISAKPCLERLVNKILIYVQDAVP